MKHDVLVVFSAAVIKHFKLFLPVWAQLISLDNARFEAPEVNCGELHSPST